MNEPHNIPDMAIWAKTVQAAVTAIRGAGATSQMILLPGNDFTGAQTFVSNGSAGNLSTVHNPDGSNTSLIFDVHKYLDSDGSGTQLECVSDHVTDTFTPLAAFLKAQGRMAILSETGGGNSSSVRFYLFISIVTMLIMIVCDGSVLHIDVHQFQYRCIHGLRRLGSWWLLSHRLQSDDDADGFQWKLHGSRNCAEVCCWNAVWNV
jgi:hypothetical protein